MDTNSSAFLFMMMFAAACILTSEDRVSNSDFYNK
jgi:hypothetical protein